MSTKTSEDLGGLSEKANHLAKDREAESVGEKAKLMRAMSSYEEADLKRIVLLSSLSASIGRGKSHLLLDDWYRSVTPVPFEWSPYLGVSVTSKSLKSSELQPEKLACKSDVTELAILIKKNFEEFSRRLEKLEENRQTKLSFDDDIEEKDEGTSPTLVN